MKLENAPVAKSEMLIRRPVSEVFEALVDPAVTLRFWFTKGSRRLESGKEVRWDWEMFEFSVQVKMREVEKDKRIVVDGEPMMTARRLSGPSPRVPTTQRSLTSPFKLHRHWRRTRKESARLNRGVHVLFSQVLRRCSNTMWN
jgi:uncharacterized protein YndB with AHSA1/START domain